MNTFLKKWTHSGINDDNNDPIPFTLFDLILSLFEKDAQGYGKIYKSQYSQPNRIRLAYASDSEPGGDRPELINFFSKNSNVLDLAIGDVDLKEKKEQDMFSVNL